MITVTTTDHDTGDTETMELDEVPYILVINKGQGFYVADRKKNVRTKTEVITIKKERTE